MSTEYKAVTRFKLGPDEDGNDQGYLERGEVIDVDLTDEQAADLLASGSILPSDEFDAQFPKVKSSENQPTGTPSNLGQIEGTDLEASDQSSEENEGSSDENEPSE